MVSKQTNACMLNRNQLSKCTARNCASFIKQESPFKRKCPPPSRPTALLSVLYKFLWPISGLSDELPELKLHKHPQKNLVTLLGVQKTWTQLLTP